MAISVRIVSVAFALLLAAGVQADTREKEAVQLNVKHPSMEEQVQRIETALASDNYSELSLEDKGKVRAALNRIRSTMGTRTSVDELAPGQRTEVGNDQAIVNTLLTQAHADSRMVCRRERVIGSNFPQQQCMTVGQRRRAMDDGQEAIRLRQRNSQHSL